MMNMATMLLYVLLFALVNALAVAAVLVYRLFFHPLAKIPGPFFARCSTLWQNWCYWRGTWHDDILRVHEKYGPVVRINHAEVSFVDAEAFKRVYGHNNPCKKVPRYLRFADSRRHGITHGKRKSAMARFLSKILRDIPSFVVVQPKHMQ